MLAGGGRDLATQHHSRRVEQADGGRETRTQDAAGITNQPHRRGVARPEKLGDVVTLRSGAAGASFSPFLTGERGVVAAPAATAAWSGLTPSVGRAELARSAFEALAFTVRRGLEALNLAAQAVVLTGGGARDPWVRQLIGDVLGQPLRYVPLRSASAIGAAVLAARGVGESLTVATDVLDVLPAAEPRMEAAYAGWRAAGKR